MMFTSSTQANDSMPFRIAYSPDAARIGLRSGSYEFGGESEEVVYDPRSGCAVRANPILAEFRKIKNKYGTVADSARWCLENGVWEPDSSLLGGADVTHARKVLTRLAQWKEN